MSRYGQKHFSSLNISNHMLGLGRVVLLQLLLQLHLQPQLHLQLQRKLQLQQQLQLHPWDSPN